MLDQYNALERPAASSSSSGVSVYAVKQLREGIFLARSSEDCPAFVFASPAGASRPTRPLRLQHLSVSFCSECRLERAGKAAILPGATVVECAAASAGLAEYFLDTVGSCVQRMSGAVSEEEIANMLDVLAELFRVMAQPARREAAGLWAELFLITSSADPVRMVRAWHMSAGDKFDFADGTDRLEVKASMRETRCHHFAYDQAHPPAGCIGYVASIIIRRSAAGMSVADLWKTARGQMGTAVDLLKVDTQCLLALGAGWEQARQERFDSEFARGTLRIFAVEDIPRVPLCVVPGVSDIHFVTDLTFSVPLQRSNTSPLLGLLPQFGFGPI